MLGVALAPQPGVFDAIIVGGGPAGLSAALVLGRCRRRILLLDAGQPRNARSRGLHSYLTRDGCPPLELRRLGREELRRYGVDVRDRAAKDVERSPDGFIVTLDNDERATAPLVLIASGVRDHVPDIPGISDCFGISVHHCPYCDGWESRDRTIAVIGHGAGATGLALSLHTWSPRVVLCSNGPARLTPRLRLQLTQHRIEVHQGRVERVEHEQGQVRQLVIARGAVVPCDVIFFSAGQSPQTNFPHKLGCEVSKHGVIKTDHLARTCVPGLYVAGDASRDVQFAIVAAAEGAKAAVAMNKDLQARAGLAVSL